MKETRLIYCCFCGGCFAEMRFYSGFGVGFGVYLFGKSRGEMASASAASYFVEENCCNFPVFDKSGKEI